MRAPFRVPSEVHHHAIVAEAETLQLVLKGSVLVQQLKENRKIREEEREREGGEKNRGRKQKET